MTTITIGRRDNGTRFVVHTDLPVKHSVGFAIYLKERKSDPEHHQVQKAFQASPEVFKIFNWFFYTGKIFLAGGALDLCDKYN